MLKKIKPFFYISALIPLIFFIFLQPIFAEPNKNQTNNLENPQDQISPQKLITQIFNQYNEIDNLIYDLAETETINNSDKPLTRNHTVIKKAKDLLKIYSDTEAELRINQEIFLIKNKKKLEQKKQLQSNEELPILYRILADLLDKNLQFSIQQICTENILLSAEVKNKKLPGFSSIKVLINLEPKYIQQLSIFNEKHEEILKITQQVKTVNEILVPLEITVEQSFLPKIKNIVTNKYSYFSVNQEIPAEIFDNVLKNPSQIKELKNQYKIEDKKDAK